MGYKKLFFPPDNIILLGITHKKCTVSLFHWRVTLLSDDLLFGWKHHILAQSRSIWRATVIVSSFIETCSDTTLWSCSALKVLWVIMSHFLCEASEQPLVSSLLLWCSLDSSLQPLAAVACCQVSLPLLWSLATGMQLRWLRSGSQLDQMRYIHILYTKILAFSLL